jgi:pyridoxal 4-dehydrogenase
MDGPLAGQVAIVTGAARGIGRATAERLAVDGARVVLVDRDAEAVQAAASSIGDRTVPLVVDVTDPLAVRNGMEHVLTSHGRVDVLVNNAGVYPHTPFGSLSFDEWRRVMAINLDGMFLMTRSVWAAMVQRGYGRIVNIGSATLWIGYPELAAYIASKGGVVGFTRGLAHEAGAHGITVNCVTPGFIDTEGSRAEDPTGELFDEIVAGQAVKQRGRPDDIVECIAYLVSPTAGYITGQTVNVDGGHRLH